MFSARSEISYSTLEVTKKGIIISVYMSGAMLDIRDAMVNQAEQHLTVPEKKEMLKD